MAEEEGGTLSGIPSGIPSAGDRRRLAELAVPPGLCATCEHLRLVASRRSVFVRCGLAETDPAFPRYPPLPVRACSGWRPVVSEDGPEKAGSP